MYVIESFDERYISNVDSTCQNAHAEQRDTCRGCPIVEEGRRPSSRSRCPQLRLSESSLILRSEIKPKPRDFSEFLDFGCLHSREHS